MARIGRAGMVVLFALVAAPSGWADTPGVSDTTIRIGGVMDLKGDSRGLGQGMKAGIEAAIKGKKIKGKSIEFDVLNDFYDPAHTVEATEQLAARGIFAMVGNVGTPTAKVSLPILAKHGIPAVGFFTGAGLLRPGVGDIINYRASYVQETAAVIDAAIAAGVKPEEVCAFVQNDAYGMAGVSGVKRALTDKSGMQRVTTVLGELIAMEGPEPQRNGIGPVGVYQRNTLSSRAGYDSLKAWEEAGGNRCRLVVGVGTYAAIARFDGYSRYKGEDWVVSAVSFTGADNLRAALKDFGVTDRVIVTQVVPPLDSSLSIVKEARKALGDDFGYVTLEGYIVGRMFLEIMQNIKGEITRENFLKAVSGRTFDLGGLTLDFTDDNQGSDLVVPTYLDEDGYKVVGPDELREVFRQ